jgi:hypothetical protein
MGTKRSGVSISAVFEAQPAEFCRLVSALNGIIAMPRCAGASLSSFPPNCPKRSSSGLYVRGPWRARANMSLSKMAMGSTSASGAEDAVAIWGDAAITSHMKLQNYVLSAAEKSTAIVTKVGSRRGSRKLRADRRELMGKNVTLLSGDTGRALVQPRCVFFCQLHRRELHRLLTAICFFALCRAVSASFASSSPLFGKEEPARR